MQTAITALSVVWCLTGLFLIYRMWKAHRLRIDVMKDDLDTYARLPSYSEMVFKFWRPLSSFVEEAIEDAAGEEKPMPQKPGQAE